MRRFARTAAAATLALTTVAGCAQAPITGREQLMIVSDQQAAQAGAQAFQDILSKSTISHDPQMTATVQRVVSRLAKVVDQGHDWKVALIQDDTANAFALPGGEIGVNTGLFKVVQNDAQLAAVLGHEMAHVTAHHTAERMSRQALLQTGLQGLGAASLGQYAQILSAAAKLGVVLPFSRTQEAEADRIGLHYMAEAGYDPRQAVNLWQNMLKAGNNGPPQFLSDHPSPGNRIAMIEAELPKVMPIYEKNKRS